MNRRLDSRLRRAAVRLEGERVDLGRLLQAHGSASQGALLMLLAAPCLLPVPGVGSVLGLGLVALAWAMWCGQHGAALPGPVARLSLPQRWARRVLALLARVHGGLARISRPRLTALAGSPQRGPMALLVAWMALLIILPIPFGNVLPALTLMLLGAGLVALDGVLVLAALGMAAMATALPVGLAAAAWLWGPAAVAAVLPGL